MTILPQCVEQSKRYIWAWKIKSKNRHISLGGPARFLWWWIVDKSLYYSKRKIFFQRGGFKEGRKKERRCYLYKSPTRVHMSWFDSWHFSKTYFGGKHDLYPVHHPNQYVWALIRNTYLLCFLIVNSNHFSRHDNNDQPRTKTFISCIKCIKVLSKGYTS